MVFTTFHHAPHPGQSLPKSNMAKNNFSRNGDMGVSSLGVEGTYPSLRVKRGEDGMGLEHYRSLCQNFKQYFISKLSLNVMN